MLLRSAPSLISRAVGGRGGPGRALRRSPAGAAQQHVRSPAPGPGWRGVTAAASGATASGRPEGAAAASSRRTGGPSNGPSSPRRRGPRVAAVLTTPPRSAQRQREQAPPQRREQREQQRVQEHIPPMLAATIAAAAFETEPQLAGRAPAGGPASELGTYIEEVRIQDFALVTQQTVRFAPGLNAITGESGAGKSVLIEALGQLLGAPAPPECVRAPASTAVIEGEFALSPAAAARVAAAGRALGLPARALPAAGGGGAARLLVRREITTQPLVPDGSDAPSPQSDAAALVGVPRSLRSRCFINGAPTSLRVLRTLSALLVDTNGQHAAIGLKDADTQLALLDRIAGNTALAAALAARQARLAAIHDALRGLDALGDDAERGRLEKFVSLVERARVEPGEERRLRAALRSMEARRSSLEQAALLRAAIRGESGGGGLLDGLRTVAGQLGGLVAAEEAISLAEAQASSAGEEEEEEEGEEEQGAGRSSAAARGAARRAAARGGWEEEGSGSGSGGEAEGAAYEAWAEGEEEDEGAGDEDEDPEFEEPRDPTGLDHLEMCVDALEEAKAQLQAAAERLSQYAQHHGFSPADYAEAQSRLEVLERLMRSQRVRSSEELLAAAAAVSARLEQYYDAEGRRGDWEAEAVALQERMLSDALQLSAARQAAAGRLRAAVEECLGELAMGGCRFDVRISWEMAGAGTPAAKVLEVGESEAVTLGQARGGGYKLRPQGLDQVEFLLAAGPAEPLRPLAAIASGGESARVMLALKAAPAAAAAAAAAASGLAAAADAVQPEAGEQSGAAGGQSGGEPDATAVPVLVLDELDSGIGSRLGLTVGRLLRRMCAESGGGGGEAGGLDVGGAASQVLCVTHLPQVAAHAAHHIVVAKAGGARRETVFKTLGSDDDRAAEIAAMLGSGGEAAARELLAQAARGNAAAAAAAAAAEAG